MTKKGEQAEDRAARLAAALRGNLHRRKAQARARAADAREDTDAPGPEPEVPAEED